MIRFVTGFGWLGFLGCFFFVVFNSLASTVRQKWGALIISRVHQTCLAALYDSIKFELFAAIPLLLLNDVSSLAKSRHNNCRY